VVREELPALRQARQIARFLCGLTSPATSRAKLGKHDAFGLLEAIPFREVLEQVETMVG
jgi:ATP-dependent DNA helicase RecQ